MQNKYKKERFTSHLTKIEPASDNFGLLLDNMSNHDIKAGVVVKGKVIDIQKGYVVVDVGLKNEGRIALEEFHLIGADFAPPKIDDIIEVYIEDVDDRHGFTRLSYERAIKYKLWGHLEEKYLREENIQGTITHSIKGGFRVDIAGVTAFLPGGQVDVKPVKDFTAFIGTTDSFRILSMDKKLGNIVVSRRKILEESLSEDREKIIANIKQGDIVTGVIKNITDYGAFIDLGGFDGLLHVTDISWRRINHPSELLKVGEQIKVVIIKFNEATKRVSLGMKQLEDNPWKKIEANFPVGTIKTGKVTSIADYGVFVELEDNIEGLVHFTEISWTKSNQHHKKLLNIGDEVKYKVLEVDTQKHRVSLSIKQCEENPFYKFCDEYSVGQKIKATVKAITESGIFVLINGKIDGFIHYSNLSWDSSKNDEIKAAQNKNEEIEAIILQFDHAKDRVELGLKQLTEDPNAAATAANSSNSDNKADKSQANAFEIDFKKGDVVTCTVVETKDAGLDVIVAVGDHNISGFIKKSDLADEKNEQRVERFAKGDRLDAKVTSIDSNLAKIHLSKKALEIDERKKVIQKYGSTDSGASLGSILGNAILDKKNSDEK